MKRKIFFTDLDGTLLNDKKEVTPLTRKTLDDLIKAGHYLVLSSGRPLDSVLEIRDDLGFHFDNMYCIANNGGLIYDISNQTSIHENRMTMEETAYILHSAKEAGIYCHTYSDHEIIAPVHSAELDVYLTSIHMPFLIADDPVSVLKQPPYKCLAMELANTGCIQKFHDFLAPWAKGHLSLVNSGEGMLEMFPATSGKGAAIAVLCDKLGIPISDTLAAGDQDNDLTMLEMAGLGVAMCNGSDNAKKSADMITVKDNNQDGLVPILKEFFSL